MPLLYIPDEQVKDLRFIEDNCEVRIYAEPYYGDRTYDAGTYMLQDLAEQTQHGTPLLPMEQAPMDGTDVLIMAKGGEFFVAYWANFVSRYVYAFVEQANTPGWCAVKDPIGWLPLPKVAPTQQGT